LKKVFSGGSTAKEEETSVLGDMVAESVETLGERIDLLEERTDGRIRKMSERILSIELQSHMEKQTKAMGELTDKHTELMGKYKALLYYIGETQKILLALLNEDSKKYAVSKKALSSVMKMVEKAKK